MNQKENHNEFDEDSMFDLDEAIKNLNLEKELIKFDKIKENTKFDILKARFFDGKYGRVCVIETPEFKFYYNRKKINISESEFLRAVDNGIKFSRVDNQMRFYKN